MIGGARVAVAVAGGMSSMAMRPPCHGARMRAKNPPMAAATTRTIRTNGIRMAITEQGEGPSVVLCHGFPELAYSWRHQLPALAAAGFRAIAPDQPGYGGPDPPRAVTRKAIHPRPADTAARLDALGLERAVFAGHDWGGIVVWHMPLLHPARTA